MEPVAAGGKVQKARRAWELARPTLAYWMETEVHVYGFSIAANVLLSFFPFLIVMVSLCRYVLDWPTAEQAIYLAMQDYFPGETGDFLVRNLKATVARRGPFQYVSVALLLFTANGIFEPLEVALNRVWRITANRSFWGNQAVSLGLIFACGALAMVSTLFTAMNSELLGKLFPDGGLATVISVLFFKLAALPVTVTILFLIYWLLPNGKLPWRRLVVPAVLIGVLIEVLKLLNLALWPVVRTKLQGEYGPFVNSVTILLWSFVVSMLVLAGAEWASRQGPAGGADPVPDRTE